jgi:hypothetical protein
MLFRHSTFFGHSSFVLRHFTLRPPCLHGENVIWDTATHHTRYLSEPSISRPRNATSPGAGSGLAKIYFLVKIGI